MTIDGIGPIDPVNKFNKTNKVQKQEKSEKSDSVSFSQQAKEMGEIYKATEQVKLTPDVRADKVAEIKAKLEDPEYINETVVNALADRLLDAFGIK
jgi:negative regulator of flagellin synthesis FlgM